MGIVKQDDRQRKTIMRKSIAEYWLGKCITPMGDVVDFDQHSHDDLLVVDDVLEPSCWGCGEEISGIYYTKKYETLASKPDLHDALGVWDMGPVKLEKCHIVPFAHGGKDDPSNMFLLCHNCHLESPDTLDPRGFFRWVYRQRHRGPCIGGFFIKEVAEHFVDECRVLRKDPWTIKWDQIWDRVFPHSGKIAESSLVSVFSASCDDLLPDSVFDDVLKRGSESFEYNVISDMIHAGFVNACADEGFVVE